MLLVAVLAMNLAACGKNQVPKEQSNANATDQTQTAQTDGDVKSGLWENAIYNTDTELGKGSKNLIVEVKADNQSVEFTIHTDASTVGEALLENNLIAGDDSQYGLYIKSVNGIVADYDVDQSYWAFYVDGEYATAGADSTDIVEESVYKFEYTK